MPQATSLPAMTIGSLAGGAERRAFSRLPDPCGGNTVSRASYALETQAKTRLGDGCQNTVRGGVLGCRDPLRKRLNLDVGFAQKGKGVADSGAWGCFTIISGLQIGLLFRGQAISPGF